MDKKTQKNLLRITKESYEAISSHYSETRKKEFSSAWEGLLKICGRVERGKKILDVGCGSGKLLKILNDKEVEYLGVDNSQAMLQEALRNYPNYKFVCGDILELNNLPKINFDYVFCVAALHHLPGIDLRIKALKQMKNKISPNGKIIISVWNLHNQKKFRRLIWKFLFLKMIGKNKMDYGDILFDWKNSQGQSTGQRYYHAFTKRELFQIAKKSGLLVDDFLQDKGNYYVVLKK